MTTTQEQAQEVAAQAKEQAGQAASQAKGRLREQVDQRSTTAGERVSTTATDARSIADALREKGQDQPAKLAEQAADRAEQLGDYLKRADADAILRDVEDFGRRQPMAIVFGGLALGFAASRFLKASSAERYQADVNGTAGQLPPRTSAPTNGAAPPVGTTGVGVDVGIVPPPRTGLGAEFPDPVVPPVPSTPPRTGGL